ncbi:MAG: hypothetical protein MUO23_10935 [Anaerolineales bacterium]|nr:hypothetical protein [Anaerolineales bacterium]
MSSPPTAVTDRLWAGYEISDRDLEFIFNLLLDREVPLTPAEMVRALVEERLASWEAEAQAQRAADLPSYVPAEGYGVGQTLCFPLLGGQVGQVMAVRPGENPALGNFEVITVAFAEDRPREFAARLADHALSRLPAETASLDGEPSLDLALRVYGSRLEAKLADRLSQTPDIVRIAGRWFPTQLLADVNVGHLNLAEAVLDMAGGGPLPTAELLPHLGLPESVDSLLAAFSVDYALQENERFDEVGPAGQVLWFLRRLEPPEVLFRPPRLEPASPTPRLPSLSDGSLSLCRQVDDELSLYPAEPADEGEVRLALLFPHWRVGTLPLSSRLRPLFPTAYEAPRIRFILVDGHSGEKFPGWVVRADRYVFGLEEWYRRHEVPVGGLIQVRRGETPGEVIVQVVDRRRRTEWIRTVAIGEGGQIGFSMLKQPVGAAFDDQMIIGLPDLAKMDKAWLSGPQRQMPLEKLVPSVFRELAKLNPQSAVHGQALYSGINVLQRLPPEVILGELEARPYFVHVGDHYWRLDESAWSQR